jgi:small subunit ribosomal protein S17
MTDEETPETPAQEPEAVVEEPAAEPEAVVDEAPAAEEEPAAADAVEPEAAVEAPAADEAPAEEPAPAKAAAPKKAAPKKKAEAKKPAKKPVKAKPAERKPITRLEKPVHERGRTTERRGVVVSAAMDKTIVVKVEVTKSHRKYKKVVRRSVKFHAHDEGNTAKVGDVVRIVETRPLSATKRWRLTEIVEVAK